MSSRVPSCENEEPRRLHAAGNEAQHHEGKGGDGERPRGQTVHPVGEVDANTSFHTLAIDGIRGRDTIGSE